ncbi:MAG: hypothetical protein KDK97_02885 [Verrucomicrobiales bacterium]|nr:hypothetical protein [Verrucomicrobiales bacterium]MCP5560216.1 hypothetical protein [Verrucomicrobiaceae bacterium]
MRSSADTLCTETGHWDYSYNSWNQLTSFTESGSWGGGVRREVSYTYDAVGNRTEKLEGGLYRQSYEWDHQNRLARVWTHDQAEGRYSYDYVYFPNCQRCTF